MVRLGQNSNSRPALSGKALFNERRYFVRIIMLTILSVVGLTASVLAQDRAPISEVVVAGGPVASCAGLGTTGVTSEVITQAITEYQKRDTARLFLIAGNTNAALRVPCDTQSARVAFGDDYEGDRHQWIHPAVPQKCLDAVAVKVK
jgi:hypothetical protein